MLGDIALTVITVDRSPGPNYLHATVGNLERAGLWDSPRLRKFPMIVSSHPDVEWLREYAERDAYKRRWMVCEPDEKRGPTRNAGAALCLGAQTGAPWVLFCEDDIDVCDDFIDSVGRWLDKNASENYRLFSFGAAYDQIKSAYERGEETWQYAASDFYGTTCFAMRNADAKSLGQFWLEHVRSAAYDLVIQEWLEQKWQHTRVLASAPSFVQHIGKSSVISKTRSHVIEYTSWQGREWSYR